MSDESYATSIECGDTYSGIPDEIDTLHPDYSQLWSGYSPAAHASANPYPIQKSNLKHDTTYSEIEVGYNTWMQMACDEALQSVKSGGGPFGAVILQIDDESNTVIRFWKTHNMVTKCCDPTAHAEVNAIRSACRELGVFNLGVITREQSLLSQQGNTSHCEIYSSTEPCPMCYASICWARIPTLVFAATRFDAAEPGVGFSDLELYEQLDRSYAEHSMIVRQSSCPNSLDAFNLWKRSDVTSY